MTIDETLVERDGQKVVETCFRVRYCETDAMGIVHHTAYITWFEEGRSAYVRVMGLPYVQLEAEGVSLAVCEVTARYLQPARYDDLVVVSTNLAEIRSRSVAFVYDVRRARDDRALVTGRTRHISVDRMQRVVRLPDRVRTILGA